MNHPMAIGAYHSKISKGSFNRPVHISERSKMVYLGKPSAEFAIHGFKIKSAARDFAVQSPIG